ncbi:MAG: choice-of-anchor B family protein, partial [Bacteroidota bacterium]
MRRYYIFVCWLIFIFPLSNDAQVSLNMNLLDQWDQPGLGYNDVWGYADASGNEYAIIGSLSKIHFFRITANNTLALVDDFTPGATSIWRDFKTYGNYAYACADQGAEGLLVYDLSNLPNSVTLSHQITTDFSRAHNIYIDEANGRLYVAGSDTRSDGLMVYDVTTNPPTLLASVALTGGGYVHDVHVQNNIAYCSHGFNGYYIWDMTTPTNPAFQASFTGESGYNHSSWVSADGNTAYYAREVGVGLPMTVLDISNYNNIGVLSNWKFPLLAPNHVDNVPHNPFLLGNYLFTSYYEDGVQVFDVTDPTNVTVAAYYDTYPTNNAYNAYNGCWGVYPYLSSGKILASDDVGGLFLLELDFSGGGIPLALNLVSQTNVTCFGGNDGSLEVNASGGGAPYTYSINNGTPQPSGIFNNLLAGTYNVGVTDALGNAITVPVTITAPSAISPIITQQQNILCSGNGNGAITVSAVGGTITSGYRYSIDGVNFSFNNSFTNLSGGNYLLTVRDDFDCEGTLPFFISEPTPLITVVSNITNVNCNGNQNGVATFNTFGGTPSYTFSLDQINFQPSSTFNNLAGGNYTLLTKDVNGCETQTPFTINEAPALTLAIAQQTNLNCFGENIGVVVLDGQGGAGNLEYNVDGGNYQASSTFSNLAAGNYNFNVKDANDCITTVNATITAPPELVLQVGQITHVDCFGNATGAFTVNATGGVGNFTITTNGNTINGNTANFPNLTAGNYLVNLIDGNGCTKSENVQINENSEVQLSLTSAQNVSCFGAGDGIVEVQAIGGTGNFNYFLGNTPNGNNNVFTNLQAGQYDIIVVDDLDCQAVLPVVIDEPAAIQTTIANQTNASCAGNSNGSVTLQATGGVGNFTYTLNGNTNSTGAFNNLSAGSYAAVILDGNNCVDNISFSITASNPINAQ